MKSRYTGALLALLSIGAIAAPGVAQARHGSDDPVSHVRHEHHRFDHRLRSDDNDSIRDGRHGTDDGPNHR
jgi:hypothetical protein